MKLVQALYGRRQERTNANIILAHAQKTGNGIKTHSLWVKHVCVYTSLPHINGVHTAHVPDQLILQVVASYVWIRLGAYL
jgi:hypothetical protein